MAFFGPGEPRDFIRLVRDDSENADIWDKLEAERWKVVVQSCYCSIFDDCWVIDSRKKTRSRSMSCPANWTRFEERPTPAAAQNFTQRIARSARAFVATPEPWPEPTHRPR